jgi:hypothetical protein
MFKKASDAQIQVWIRESNLNSFGKYLLSSTVHGKPGIPVAELARLQKVIQKTLDKKEMFVLGQRLLDRSEYTARRIGISLVPHGWPHGQIESLIKKSANDEDWQVRETAAGVFAKLLEIDFKHFSKLFEGWVASESENVKRAIALAVKYDSQSQEESKWKTYYKLINPLMAEDSEYIRKNLGPFAIGDGLLIRFPEQTLKACEKWAQSKNENVKWNTAMIFTAAAAKKHAKIGKKILSKLQCDEIEFVAKAAQKAFKTLSSERRFVGVQMSLWRV